MTNAIEQSKREMYGHLKVFKKIISLGGFTPAEFVYLENSLESYLELLRQDHEALHETARKRFEDIQSLEAVNHELTQRLSNMTDERDKLRNQMQAIQHSYSADNSLGSTLGQSSAENASCATLDGKTAAILCAVASAQRVMVEYLVPDGIRAKDAIGKMIPILDNERLYTAMRGFERPVDGYEAWFINNTQCMHSFPSGKQCVFCGVGK